MKPQIRLIPALISIGIALLIGYGFYAANSSEWQRWLMFGVSAVTFIILLGGGLDIRYAERGGGNITALSLVFVIFALIVNVIFTFASFHAAPYIVIMGAYSCCSTWALRTHSQRRFHPFKRTAGELQMRWVA